MTWLQKKGEPVHLPNKAGAPAIEHIRKHMEHDKSSNFFLPTDPRCRDMEMKQDEVWQKRLPEFTQTRSAAGR